MSIVFRPARDADIPQMCDLLYDLFTLESDFEPDKGKQAAALAMLIRTTQGDSLVLVAADGARVFGMATVQTLVSTAEGGRVGLVEDVVVDKAFRGQGIGTLLLEHLAAWARSQGLKRLQLLADRDNGRANDFYARNGWQSTRLSCLRKKL